MKESEDVKASFFTFETPKKSFELKCEIMTPAFSAHEF